MDKPIIEFETGRLVVRSVQEGDKDEYMALRVQTSDISRAYSTIEGFTEYEWENELNDSDDIYMSVFLKSDFVFVASASIQNFKENSIYIGYDVKEEYRNMGIATELVIGLVKQAHSFFPESKVLSRIRVDNDVSRKVTEQCGGIIKGYEDTYFAKQVKRMMSSRTYNQIKPENKKVLESILLSGENGVCVYEMP